MIGQSEWRFDLDGCLVDATSATSLRPHADELLACLRAMGHVVTVWSAGGQDYANRVLSRLGIAELVDSVYGKERGSDGRWLLVGADADCVTCIDDETGSLPLGVAVIGVFPYIGHNSFDSELLSVLHTARSDGR